MKAVVINVGAQPKTVDIKDGISSMQKIVGGYVEAVCPFNEGTALICNKEGKLNGMMPNRPLLDEKKKVLDIIFGNFLIVGVRKDDFCSLTDKQVKRYMAMFRLREVK